MSVVEQWVMVRLRVTVLSHPAAFMVVNVAVSADSVWFVPCQRYLLQVVTVSVDEVLWLIVRLSVSLPWVYMPVVVYVVLFQV